MTVSELIEELKKAPPEMVVSAWDGDYQHSVPVTVVHIDDDEVWLGTAFERRGVSDEEGWTPLKISEVYVERRGPKSDV